ncbi:MAG: type VI secretion system-associated protein TagF [Polyangiales bacterium]
MSRLPVAARQLALGAGASLFGKLPDELDFVRIQHSFAESILLDRFLQAALQRLAARGTRWPDTRLAFVIGGTSGQALVGVLSASRDRARRQYPLAIYARVPLLDGHSAALPLACERFVGQVGELSARSQTLPLAQLSAELRRLRPPTLRDVTEANEQLTRELERSVPKVGAALYPGAQEPAAALHDAFTQLGASHAPDGSPIDGFACPAATTRDVSVWAAALEQSRAGATCCSALWQPDTTERVLIAAGPLPERALLYTAQPNTKHPRLRRLDLTDPLAAAHSGDDSSVSALLHQLAHSRSPLRRP